MYIYVVRAGDTLERISRISGVSEEAIAYVNQIFYPYNLAVGQALLLTAEPTGGAAAEFSSGPERGANGRIWNMEAGAAERLRISVYQSLDSGTDAAVSDLPQCIFLWIYCRRHAGAAGGRRYAHDQSGESAEDEACSHPGTVG